MANISNNTPASLDILHLINSLNALEILALHNDNDLWEYTAMPLILLLFSIFVI